MYRRCLKLCPGSLHEFYSRDPFDSCQSMIRGVSITSVAEAFASQGRRYSRFARDAPTEVPRAWRLSNRGYWRLAQLRRREFTTSSSQSWSSCSESDCPPSAAFLLRQQRLLSGYAFRSTGANLISSPLGWISRKESLFRISASCIRSYSDGTNSKNQAALSSSVGSGGDGEKGAEHVLACDSGGEEDENDEGRHSAANSMGQDERSREEEMSHSGNRESLFLAQKVRFKKVFEKRVVRWEDLNVTLEEFPHYLR